MTKYVRRKPSRQYWNQDIGADIPEPRVPVVHERDEDEEPIGLVDAAGMEICRLRRPIGFIARL